MKAAFTALIALALPSCATVQTSDEVAYFDAHSHLAEGLTPDEEIAAMRDAGLAGVVIMHADPPALADVTAKAGGFVVPFVSIARLPEMPGIRLGPDSAARMTALVEDGKACGFGEIPTRVVPRAEPADSDALLNPDRRKIYAEANRLGKPVNLHVDIANEAVAASIATIARDYPKARIVLAHAGWSASAATIGALMDTYPNVSADLSVRLDPAEGLPSDPLPPGSLPPGATSVISVIREDGSLQTDWRDLMARRPDRFLFAMDITQRERPRHIALLLATARKALAPLGLQTERMIASGNLAKILTGCKT